MCRLYRHISVLLLSAVLVAPQAIMATPNQDENRQNDTRDRQNNDYSRNQQGNDNKRVYDLTRKFIQCIKNGFLFSNCIAPLKTRQSGPHFLVQL
jgi:hypothetical protein